MLRLSLAFLIVAVLGVSLAKNKDPNFKDNRSTIVHLFEWKWKDIAVECETYLGPMGFGGIQTSPVNENLMVTSRNRPWWERYQPISYKLDTRSGNEADFADMVKRCNAVGVRIYPDIIINHMTGTWPENVGTGGSTVTFATWDYPGVPYTKDHFNQPICTINNYQDPVQVRNCELLDLKDLNQTHPHVRDMTVNFMNKLIDLGAAGFRIDAAKHIWPADLEHIFDRLNDLNTDQGFAAGSRPFIFQEVIDLGGEPIKVDEYLPFGAITEFKACAHLGRVFSGKDQSKWLVNWGVGWGLVADGSGVIFVDNHDNQRGHGAGGDILSYKQPKQYKAAIAFMLGHPYGVTRIMSSFAFTDPEVGPPMDANQDIISPIIQPDGLCDSNWVCEHRWTAIAGMVGFRNEVQGELLDEWWDNDASQIAFCRGQKGFIAINTDGSDLNGSMQTCLPAGTYCDVITGRKQGDSCTGKSVTVDATGLATISIPFSSDEAVLAIHTGAKLGSDNTPTTSTTTSGTSGTTATPGQCPSGQVAISINMDSGSFAGCLTRV